MRDVSANGADDSNNHEEFLPDWEERESGNTGLNFHAGEYSIGYEWAIERLLDSGEKEQIFGLDCHKDH